jgi:ATPase family associated with various cellular activities (AAA)
MSEDMNEFMEQLGIDRSANGEPYRSETAINTAAPAPAHTAPADGDLQQWRIGPNGMFGPCGKTTQTIPPAIYGVDERPDIGVYFQMRKVVTDDLLRLPDSKGEQVLQSIQNFWEREAVFRQYKQIFKRGILLFGPPGSGKSSVLALLMHDLIERGGIVVIADRYPHLIRQGLTMLRLIEPTRPVITIFEDIDELCRQYGEAQLLSLFDGEGQIDKVCHLATTNYPQLLDERFINRPSRFDEVIKIGMPSPEARRAYLTTKFVTGSRLEQWVRDTEGFSIAHLRELFVAVVCLGNSYESVLTRLRAMQRPPKSAKESKVGFEAYTFADYSKFQTGQVL